MSLMYEEYGYENHIYALNAVTEEIESGTFDVDDNPHIGCFCKHCNPEMR